MHPDLAGDPGDEPDVAAQSGDGEVDHGPDPELVELLEARTAVATAASASHSGWG